MKARDRKQRRTHSATDADSCSRHSGPPSGYHMRGSPLPRLLCDGLLLVLCI